MNISLYAFVPEYLVSRDGFGIPSRINLLISILRLNLGFLLCSAAASVYLCTTAIRHRVRIYRVTQLRIDGVHCRESAGTRPVKLKVVPNECCLGR